MALQIDIENTEPLDMKQRFSLKLKNGKRKHPKPEIFFSVDSNKHGYYIVFNEEWSRGEGTHSHVWIRCRGNRYIMLDLIHFIKREKIRLPYRTWSIIILEFYSGINRWKMDYDNPGYEVELLIGKKLSRTLVRQLYSWLNDLLDVFIPNLNMTYLFSNEGGGVQ